MKHPILLAAILFSTTAIITPLQLKSQDSTYYQSIEGLKKDRLKTALSNIIQPTTVLNYGGKGEGYTWSGFAVTDTMPDGTVRDRYSDEVRSFNGLNAVSGMNIEHVFANSWWGHTVNNAYKDLYNLYPSDATANGRKSNNPIGIVTQTPTYDNGVIRVGKSTSYSTDSLIIVWEPADQWKGDFARTHFYMATCYEDYQSQWQTTEGLLMLQPNTYPTLQPWVTNILLQWNQDDPVDEIERTRNDEVQAIQGNRNPFVDYPNLATYIWGDSTEHAFYTNPASTTPQLFVPAETDTLDFGLQALSFGYEGTLTVRGRNITDLTLTTQGTDITIGTATLTQNQITDGVDISLRSNPTQAGICTTQLTLEGANYKQTNILKIQFVDGIPAYAATDIVCSVNSKKFTASWMNMGTNLTYTLDVYTKTADGVHTSIDNYPITTTETTQTVQTNLKASTTYYYNVSILDSDGTTLMTSNEVTVDMPAVTPVFSANTTELTFTTVPGRPSTQQTITVTALAVSQYQSTVTTVAPFEVSSDGQTWAETTTVSGSSQTIYVRLGTVDYEGTYQSEMIISTPDVADIVVSLSAEVNTLKSFYETFETGTKTAYAEAQVTCAAATWRMAQTLIGNLDNDNKNNDKAARMQVKSGVETILEMTEDKTDGCDTLSFYAGLFGSDTGVKLTTSYSTDGGMTWTTVADEQSFTKGQWDRYTYHLGIEGLIRIRFQATGTSSKRLNIDDIQMDDYPATDNNSTDDTDHLTLTPAGNPTDMVDVYTLSGIHVRRAMRKNALNGLRPDRYIIK